MDGPASSRPPFLARVLPECPPCHIYCRYLSSWTTPPLAPYPPLQPPIITSMPLSQTKLSLSRVTDGPGHRAKNGEREEEEEEEEWRRTFTCPSFLCPLPSLVMGLSCPSLLPQSLVPVPQRPLASSCVRPAGSRRLGWCCSAASKQWQPRCFFLLRPSAWHGMAWHVSGARHGLVFTQ